MTHQTKIAELTEILAQRIHTGVYPPGTRLPAERTLAAAFQVSRQTVHVALGLLQDQELLEIHPSSGAHVRGPRPLLPLGARAFPTASEPPIDLQVRPLAGAAFESITPAQAQAMGLPEQTRVLCQRQLILVGQIPYHLLEHASPLALLATIPQAGNDPLRWLLFHRETGAAPPHLTETLTFRQPTPEERHLLQVRSSSLLLDLQRWLHLADGQLLLSTHIRANSVLHTYTTSTQDLSWPDLLARLTPAP